MNAKAIVYHSIKGGVGKSTHAILAAEYLAYRGHKVLVIDSDVQNSSSYYFLADSEANATCNLAMALASGNLLANIIKIDDANRQYAEVVRSLHGNPLANAILAHQVPNIDIIPSSLALLDYGGSRMTMKNCISQVRDKYDYVIMDTAGSMDAVVLNMIKASDHIISPIDQSPFCHKSTRFMGDMIHKEFGEGELEKWRLLKNCWLESRSDSENTRDFQYSISYEAYFKDRILQTIVPRSAAVRNMIEDKESFKTKKAAPVLEMVGNILSEVLGETV